MSCYLLLPRDTCLKWISSRGSRKSSSDLSSQACNPSHSWDHAYRTRQRSCHPGCPAQMSWAQMYHYPLSVLWGSTSYELTLKVCTAQLRKASSCPLSSSPSPVGVS